MTKVTPQGTPPSGFRFPRVNHAKLHIAALQNEREGALKIIAGLQWTDKVPSFDSALSHIAVTRHPLKRDTVANAALYSINLALRVPKKYLDRCINRRVAFDEYICAENADGAGWIDTRELFEARKANVLKQVGNYWGIQWVGLV